jgi:hypothetical protein
VADERIGHFSKCLLHGLAIHDRRFFGLHFGESDLRAGAAGGAS